MLVPETRSRQEKGDNIFSCPPSSNLQDETCDQQALPVAQAALAASEAELVILFGSRARGDYDPFRSDIDLLLLQHHEPDAAGKQAVCDLVQTKADEIYNGKIAAQLIWRTLDQFRHNRRYINSVETNAIKDGIVMPRNLEDYHAEDYEDEEVEYAHDWSNYSERLRHAEDYRTGFELMDATIFPDTSLGQHGHSALEHSMKALILAHDGDYRNSHNLGRLLGTIRRLDPQMREFQLAIPPDIYTAYAGNQEYKIRTQPRLTEFPDYKEQTLKDIQLLLDRAKEVRAQRT